MLWSGWGFISVDCISALNLDIILLLFQKLGILYGHWYVNDRRLSGLDLECLRFGSIPKITARGSSVFCIPIPVFIVYPGSGTRHLYTVNLPSNVVKVLA